MKTEVDVLIIGAGPAGSTAAALLQKQGLRLLVVEKQVFPRFVIGESLLPHCMDLLSEAGLLDAVTRPFLRPLRRRIPPLGSVDLTVLVLIIACQLILIVPLTWLENMAIRLL